MKKRTVARLSIYVSVPLILCILSLSLSLIYS